MKRSKFGNVILCERIYPGEFNKHILCNTYSGDVVVQELPATIPFSVYVEVLTCKVGEDVIRVELLVNDHVVFGGTATAVSDRVGSIVVLALPMHMTYIEKGGTIKVRVAQESLAPTIALNKKVMKGNLAQPSKGE